MLSMDYHTDTLGYVRPLGLMVPPSGSISRFKDGFQIPLAPQSDWQEFDLTKHPFYPLLIKDQDGRGACNGHAAAESMELARWLNGQPHVPLSGWFPYAIMCNGWDTGSMISDALALVQSKGLAPEADVQYGLINPRRLTQTAYTNALDYKCEIGAPLETWEQIMSAVQLKLGGINLSIRVGSTFEPDDEGVVTVSRGPGNHAITAGHGAKKLKDGRWAILWQNHWTTKWGLKGYAWMTQDHWDKQNGREAYVVRTPVENGSDNSKPPAAV